MRRLARKAVEAINSCPSELTNGGAHTPIFSREVKGRLFRDVGRRSSGSESAEREGGPSHSRYLTLALFVPGAKGRNELWLMFWGGNRGPVSVENLANSGGHME